MEDLVDSIGDLIVSKEVVLDVVGLVCVILGKVGQLSYKDVFLISTHPVYFLLLPHQKLTVLLYSLLFCYRIQAIILSWEVDPPRIVIHLTVCVLFVADCGLVRKEED